MNTAAHRGHVWSADGTLLATTVEAAASSEFGFRTLAFPSPVRIAPGVEYVISYTVPTGAYGWTGRYSLPIEASGVDAPPLHAERDNSLTGPDGVPDTRRSGESVGSTWYRGRSDGGVVALVRRDPSRPPERRRRGAFGVGRALRQRGRRQPARDPLRPRRGVAGRTHGDAVGRGRRCARHVTLPADDGAPGWRGAMLPQPIAIAADRVYTASYFAPSGGYAFGDRFFAGQAQVAGPLTAPASDDVGSNGVFRCSGGFPHRLVPRGIVRGRRQLETPLVSEPVGAG